MATAGQDKAQPGDLTAFRELIRNAAKWFVAGLGAIGAVLIAGSQLSSLGSLPAGSTRFWAAIAGVIAGLAAILWAMWRVVDVLSPKPWTFDDVVNEWNAAEGQCGKPKRRTRRVGCYLRTHLHILGDYKTVPEIKKDYDESEPDREGLGDLVQLMDGIVEKAATIDLEQRFRELRSQIAAGVLVGAAGIVLFAWAANPAKTEQPAPSLRNANLRGADLRGASLRNADLTGADLTGANLHDADLRGATIKDTVWSNTTCPDGVNSDSSARPNERGNLSGGTCEGHLLS